jgi:7-cyano-7-deazaguanine synthase in queuosine biosynthesis
MSGCDHETDHDGECFPDCRECLIESLKASRMKMFEECVRRGIAIESHKRAMESEKIQSYYFDRDLWAVMEESIG